ncbi:MAG: hypothetical protein HRU15_17305 [Planctomycetes bacterium]|nr:hypothetical protein [Planctomycetota bacterium]
MATTSVRKFALSVDPDEVLDFDESLTFFNDLFNTIGFEKVSNYTFRYNDQECMIKIDLKESQDGYFVSSYVQAEDEHKYRLQEIAEQLDGHIIG